MAHENLYTDDFPQEITGGNFPLSPQGKCCECLIYDFGATPLGLDSKPTDPKPQGMPHWLKQTDLTHPAGGGSNWVRDPEDRNTFFTTVPGATIELGRKIGTLPQPPIPYTAFPIGEQQRTGGYCLEFELETTERAYLLGDAFQGGRFAVVFNATDHYVQSVTMGGGISSPAFSITTNQTLWPSGKHKVIWWGKHCWIDGKRYSITDLSGMRINFGNGTGSTRISNFKIYETGQKGCLRPMSQWWPYKPAHSLTVGMQWTFNWPPYWLPPDTPVPPWYPIVRDARSGNFVFTWDHNIQAWACERDWGPWQETVSSSPLVYRYGTFDRAVLHFGYKALPPIGFGNHTRTIYSETEDGVSGMYAVDQGAKGVTVDFRIAGHPTMSIPPGSWWMREHWGDTNWGAPPTYAITYFGMVATDIAGSQPIDYSDMNWAHPAGSGASYFLGAGNNEFSGIDVYPAYISFAPTYADEE